MIEVYFRQDYILPVARDFSRSITFYNDEAFEDPVDLSNITFTLQIRSGPSLSSTLIGSMTCTDNGVGGAVTFVSDRTENVDFPPGITYFDLLANDGTDQKTWVYGTMDIRGSVTVNV